ncbi:MAG: ATP-binding protein, partial [Bacteroidales bacterium]
ILSEKSHSVLIELEHKLANENKLSADMEDYLSDLLIKFSLVFFSDINLYSTEGTLLASSRPEIFKKELISKKMNPTAFYNLTVEKKSRFILEENIGDYSYISAYLPFVNYDNDLIGYLNLPYFAKQEELTKEISNFLVAFINIYVILIAFAIYITLVISNYITRPLQILKDKISSLKLGKTDEKINWTKQDEIGSLVTEYNRMVDELGKSAQLLAKSERESAWREMAKQIAHEIKNPLTPMKLSVQYLQKAWNDKLPDWDQRLNRFTNTIVEQIESLSIIASAFSDFANMPRSKFQRVNIVDIISKAVDLYKDTTQISFELTGKKDVFVLADKEQILRVFINLIKNSIQAIDFDKEGMIKLTVDRSENQIIITCRDNGMGISEDEKQKVFYPNFTTKSSGMGLGLAVVKNIITNTGGTISFESEAGKGLPFKFHFRLIRNNRI